MWRFSWPALVLLAVLVLALTLYGLAMAGHFPRKARPAALRTGLGKAIFWSTALAAVLSGIAAARAAAILLPWPHIVIATGCAMLAAPLLLQPLPDGFIDGRAALLVFSGLAAALAFAFTRLAA